jgi:hypothetical protein
MGLVQGWCTRCTNPAVCRDSIRACEVAYVHSRLGPCGAGDSVCLGFLKPRHPHPAKYRDSMRTIEIK